VNVDIIYCSRGRPMPSLTSKHFVTFNLVGLVTIFQANLGHFPSYLFHAVHPFRNC